MNFFLPEYKGITFESPTFSQFITQVFQLKLHTCPNAFEVQVIVDGLEEIKAKNFTEFVVILDNKEKDKESRKVFYFDSVLALQASHFAQYREEEERESWDSFMTQISALPLDS